MTGIFYRQLAGHLDDADLDNLCMTSSTMKSKIETQSLLPAINTPFDLIITRICVYFI